MDRIGKAMRAEQRVCISSKDLFPFNAAVFCHIQIVSTYSLPGKFAEVIIDDRARIMGHPEYIHEYVNRTINDKHETSAPIGAWKLIFPPFKKL